ncbi:MAG: hypothetical protein IJ035_05485 [Oscillospiraceae bacterium]|nr:hypothetical protein [Oscillospiraceae bacterium]
MDELIFIFFGILFISLPIYSIYTLIRDRFIKYKPLDPEKWVKTTARITDRKTYTTRVVPHYKTGKAPYDTIVKECTAEYVVDGKTYHMTMDETDKNYIEFYYKKKNPRITTTEEEHKLNYLTRKHTSRSGAAIVGTLIWTIAFIAVGAVMLSSGISELMK